MADSKQNVSQEVSQDVSGDGSTGVAPKLSKLTDQDLAEMTDQDLDSIDLDDLENMNGAPERVEDETIDTEGYSVGELTPSKLHGALNDSGYICDIDLARIVFTTLLTEPMSGAFLRGPAGAGKTLLARQLGEILGMQTYFKQVTADTKLADLMVDYWPSEDHKSGIKVVEGAIIRAIRSSKKRPTLLIIDEWEKTKPSADAFLYDFLQSGKINEGDIQQQANLDNLTVFLTLNDERDLSEPLERRMPFIEFGDPHPSLVKKALIQKHGPNPYIPALISLYVRGTISAMEKPVTIQELSQLLQAAMRLGEEADWNSLVQSYVTKSVRNHEMLKRAEGANVDDWDSEFGESGAELDPDAYSELEIGDYGGVEDSSVGMPSLAEMKGYNRERGEKSPAPDLSEAYGMVRNTDLNYSNVTKLAEPGDDGDRVGHAVVEGDLITFTEPVPLTDRERVADFWGNPGEISFAEPDATLDDMRLLRDERDMLFEDYESGHVKAYLPGVMDIYWTPEDGAEIIVNLQEENAFRNVLDMWVSFGTEPIEVQARMKNDGSAVIDRRRAGIEDLRIYHSRTWDEWGSDAWDAKAYRNLSGFDGFTKLAEKKAEEIVRMTNEDTTYYLFENVMFGFIGEDNDMLALSITGKPDADLIPYIRDWAKNSLLFLQRDIPYTGSIKNLIDNHGFQINPKNEKVQFVGKGAAAVYRDEDDMIRVGSRLHGEHVSKKQVGAVLGVIQKMEEALLGG